jgi:hypothetical protein
VVDAAGPGAPAALEGRTPAPKKRVRRIIGLSSARSLVVSGRPRACRVYATSSIAFSTLAEGKTRSSRTPQKRVSVRTAKATVPGREAA